MNEKEKQKKIKELLEKDGVYEKNGFLCFHLSLIPNWYSMMDKADITCPICGKHKIKVEYLKEFNKEPIHKDIVDIYNILYAHRLIQYTCPECKTKMRYENYLKKMSELKERK
jgi:endogenous inhibitor of DNA gyrase (YacG/DUF329 family)